MGSIPDGGTTHFSPSAGTPQIWLLDIFLGQVLSIFLAWYLSQVRVGQGVLIFSAWYLSQVISWCLSKVGVSQVRFLFLAWYLSQLGVGQVRFFSFAWYLCQKRGVPPDGEKRVNCQAFWPRSGTSVSSNSRCLYGAKFWKVIVDTPDLKLTKQKYCQKYMTLANLTQTEVSTRYQGLKITKTWGGGERWLDWSLVGRTRASGGNSLYGALFEQKSQRLKKTPRF